MPDSSAAAIVLDWGTSRLRGWLLDDGGRVLCARTRDWGIRHLPDGGYAAAFADLALHWPRVPVLAAGMVGSRQGWREAPYVEAPATLQALCASLVDVASNDGRCMSIVPGVRDDAGPDVMRGEETQVFGVLETHPSLAADALVILPGTHSKWVAVKDACIARFATFMTGELYGIVSRHSILAMPDAAPEQAADAHAAAFARGLATARDSGAQGALARLFSARVLMLEGRLAPACVADYLSGLLIGEEWRAALAADWLTVARPLVLVGEPALCARYRQAAAVFGAPEPLIVADAAVHGLWRIARAATVAGKPLLEMC
ncbi:MAG TPA: 2-dehydro-3-deoxygalactonokinase [Rhodanobacteraceae bacterium]